MSDQRSDRNQQLVEARKNRGWDQDQTAKYLLISKSFYGKLERGQRKPGVHLAYAINRIFNEAIYDVNSLKHSA